MQTFQYYITIPPLPPNVNIKIPTERNEKPSQLPSLTHNEVHFPHRFLPQLLHFQTRHLMSNLPPSERQGKGSLGTFKAINFSLSRLSLFHPVFKVLKEHFLDDDLSNQSNNESPKPLKNNFFQRIIVLHSY